MVTKVSLLIYAPFWPANSKERGNLKRQDANEIVAIMSGIEGWKRPEGKMRFPLYGVVKGYIRDEETETK